MSALLDGIRKNSFVVFGRAGMDMFADPVGTKAEVAETFRSDLGGSSADICAGLSKLGAASTRNICALWAANIAFRWPSMKA